MNTAQELAACIDHTLLKPDATPAEIDQLCREAVEYGFGTVCVQPSYLALAVKKLAKTAVRPIAVVSFPCGAQTLATKMFEASQVIELGAQEIDVVISVGLLVSRNYAQLGEEMRHLVQVASPCPVKMILEIGLLNQDQRKMGCLLAMAAGAAFVKTGTGFLQGVKVKVEDVAFLKEIAGTEIQIKASGGIQTYAEAAELLKAGATRLGTSQGVKIMQEFHQTQQC